jgi:peptidoglycan biosynthesis protein MviN/MurJ (putative lipid II flippase)
MKKRQKSKQERRLDLIGAIVVGLLMLMLWVTCLTYLFAGNLFGHINHYGQPVGTGLLLTLLIIMTPLLVYIAWKGYKGGTVKKPKGKQRKNRHEEKPFIKFPWT